MTFEKEILKENCRRNIEIRGNFDNFTGENFNNFRKSWRYCWQIVIVKIGRNQRIILLRESGNDRQRKS
jgi:hypothetical protein